MNNRNSKLAIKIAVLFEIILIITAVNSIASKQWNNLAILFLAVICIFIPFLLINIADKKNIVLPENFQLISVLFVILAQYFGEIKKFYIIFWWWDLLLHAISGSYAVIIALHLIQGIIIKAKEVSKKRYVASLVIIAFSFSITLGALWEMFEFTGDYLFKTTMIKGGLEDTSSDLIVKIISALITSIIYYYHLSQNISKSYL